MRLQKSQYEHGGVKCINLLVGAMSGYHAYGVSLHKISSKTAGYDENDIRKGNSRSDSTKDLNDRNFY